MKSSFLFMGIGSAEFLILLLIVSIPLYIKISFIKQLNMLMGHNESNDNESLIRLNWLIAVPIIGFIYSIFICKKVDRIIGDKLEKPYGIYKKIINLNYWIILVKFIGQMATSNNSNYYASNNDSGAFVFNLIILALLFLRLHHGQNLLREIKTINAKY